MQETEWHARIAALAKVMSTHELQMQLEIIIRELKARDELKKTLDTIKSLTT